jgi:hypothetical protein
MGSVVGESQRLARSIVENAKGKVLLIDEAYGLDDKMYGKQALDTIVELVSGKPGEDITVVMAGYQAPMEKMFREQNEGLNPRFNASKPMLFEDYDDASLLRIFSELCRKNEIFCPIAVKKIAVKSLSLLRSLPNFGNAGAVETLFSESKARMTERVEIMKAKGENPAHNTITEEDITVKSKKVDSVDRIFDSWFGMEDLKRDLRRIGSLMKLYQSEGRDHGDLVKNYVFNGNPGTGKTEVAKNLSNILHAYGVLPTDHIEITSALDLTGQYLGKIDNDLN